MATAENFVPLHILQDHFQAVPALHVRRSHAFNVLRRRFHVSGHQVSPRQRVPLTATSGDDVVDEEQGSVPRKVLSSHCNGSVRPRGSRIKDPGAVRARMLWKRLLNPHHSRQHRGLGALGQASASPHRSSRMRYVVLC